VGDSEPSRLIVARGAAGAAVFGWLEGLLPLLPDDADAAADCRVGKLCRLLGAAEAARSRGDHGTIVDLRPWLRDLAPEVLDAYIGRLERAAVPTPR